MHFRGATGRGRAAADARWALQSTSEGCCVPETPRGTPGSTQPRIPWPGGTATLCFALGSRSSQHLQPREAPCCSPRPKGQRAPTPRGGPGRPPLRHASHPPPTPAAVLLPHQPHAPLSCEDGPPGCRIWVNSISAPSWAAMLRPR